MPISHTDYVPIIKWRQGEYQALWRLTDATKDRTVPLIEITPPDFDFETWTPSKTIDEHLAPFATRLHKKWGARLALLDCGLLDPAATMHGGKHPMLYLCEQAFAQNAVIAPVVKLTSDGAYRAAVATAQAMIQTGVALRCSLEEAMDTATFDAGIGVLFAPARRCAGKTVTSSSIWRPRPGNLRVFWLGSFLPHSRDRVPWQVHEA